MAKARPNPAATTTQVTQWRSPAVAALLLAVAGLLAYSNSFQVPFVFDDEPSIVGNETIRSLATAWRPPRDDGSLTVGGRPLLNFTFGLNYAVGGLAVEGYHAVNWLIHVSAACLVFGLVRRTLSRPSMQARFSGAEFGVALGAALWWLLHPLQTESVTYLVQRAESLGSLFYLLTLWGFVRAVDARTPRRWLIFSVVACVLGMLSKEIVVSAPVIVALYDRVFVAGSWREIWRVRWKFYGALAATWLVLAALVLSNPGRGGSAGFGAGIDPLDYALTQIGAVARYLRLVVWPAPLVLDYGDDVAGDWIEIVLPALIVLPLLGASGFGAWKGKAWGFCGIFFFALLAPSSSFVPVNQSLAEHRMYLALAGIFAVLVAALYRWLGAKRTWVTVGCVAAVLAFLTFQRNRDYSTNVRIYEDTVAKRPANARAAALLGDYYRRAGRLDEARRSLEKSLRLKPDVAPVWSNLGVVWQQLGEPAKAVPCFERALALDPQRLSYRNNLGNALMLSGREQEGLAQLEAAVRAAPHSAETRLNLANAFARSRRFAEAAEQFEHVVKLRPADAEARNGYADMLSELARPHEARAQLETVVKLQPGNADAHNRLGIAFARMGRMREALAEFNAALALDPTNVSARQNAALAQRRLSGR